MAAIDIPATMVAGSGTPRQPRPKRGAHFSLLIRSISRSHSGIARPWLLCCRIAACFVDPHLGDVDETLGLPLITRYRLSGLWGRRLFRVEERPRRADEGGLEGHQPDRRVIRIDGATVLSAVPRIRVVGDDGARPDLLEDPHDFLAQPGDDEGEVSVVVAQESRLMHSQDLRCRLLLPLSAGPDLLHRDVGIAGATVPARVVLLLGSPFTGRRIRAGARCEAPVLLLRPLCSTLTVRSTDGASSLARRREGQCRSDLPAGRSPCPGRADTHLR